MSKRKQSKNPPVAPQQSESPPIDQKKVAGLNELADKTLELARLTQQGPTDVTFDWTPKGFTLKWRAE